MVYTIGQNPAYRLIVRRRNSPLRIPRKGLFYSYSRIRFSFLEATKMHKSFSRLILAAILSTACASTQQPGSVPSNEPQTPSQASPSPTVELSTHGWQFKFMDEAHSYTSVTRTTIESLNTPVSSVDTFTTQSHFSITVNHQQVSSTIFGELNPVKVTVSQRAHNQPLAISAFTFAGSINSGQVLLHLIPIPAIVSSAQSCSLISKRVTRWSIGITSSSSDRIELE